MPSKKSSPSSPKKGSPKKSSPKKKKSSPKKNKKPSPKKNKKSPQKTEPAYNLTQRGRPPPTPPPPKGPPIVYIHRQHWYPYASEPTATIKEWYWTPHFALSTSWGDIIISDPPRRRLCRYQLTPNECKFTRCKDIIIRGEPYNLAEMPKSGRIITVIRCPRIRKTRIGIINALTGEMERKIEYPFEPLNPIDPPAVNECSALGVTAADGILFVIRNPIHQMHIYNTKSLEKIDYRDLRKIYPDTYESRCLHYSPSGGCAATRDFLYIAALRPARVMVFKIVKEFCYDLLDKVTITLLMNVNEHCTAHPYGITTDGFDMLLTSDTIWNKIHTSRSDGKLTCHFGGWNEVDMQLIRPSHISANRHGILAVVETHSNTVKVFVDKQIYEYYRKTLFYIDTVLPPSSRRTIDYCYPVSDPPPSMANIEAQRLLKEVEKIARKTIEKAEQERNKILEEEEALLSEQNKVLSKYKSKSSKKSSPKKKKDKSSPASPKSSRPPTPRDKK